MPIRPRVLQFGVETAHQRHSDSLIGSQSEAKTAIGHVSGRSQPACEMDRSCHERSTCERAPRLLSTLSSRPRRRHPRWSKTRDTKPFSDLVFRDTALNYPQPTIKSSARRTRCCKTRDLAQKRAQQLLLNQNCGRMPDLALFPMQHSGGLESSSRLPSCDRGLHEGLSPGLIGATTARSLARGSLTHLFSWPSHAVTRAPGREHGRWCSIHPAPRLVED